MIVVADTGPLNYLIQLNLVALLGELYGEIIIPDAVAQELVHPGAPSVVKRWMVDPPPWLKRVSVTERDMTLPFDLGDGEAEAISLAVQFGLAILLDDQRGRRAASQRGLETAGTLAVLIQGAILGRLDLRASLDKLKALNFRISSEIEEIAFARYRSLSRKMSS